MRQVIDRADAQGRVRIKQPRASSKPTATSWPGSWASFLTAPFIHNAPSLRSVERTLLAHQLEFAEGLQLVNILKDESVDRGEGRSYLAGRSVPRSEVLELAKNDPAGARRYIAALREGGAPVASWPSRRSPRSWPRRALRLLERDGPGAKVSRMEVFQISARVQGS